MISGERVDKSIVDFLLKDFNKGVEARIFDKFPRRHYSLLFLRYSAALILF